MTVGELVKKLMKLDPDMLVFMASDYGNRTHTTVAEEANEVEETRLVWSTYTQAYKPEEGAGDDESNDEHPPLDAVLLKGDF